MIINKYGKKNITNDIELLNDIDIKQEQASRIRI